MRSVSSQMQRLPAEPSDPLGVSCQSLPHLNPSLWVPQADLQHHNNTGSSLCVPKLNLTTCTPDTRAARPPDCSCSLKPASCHQVTRRCTAPSVCVLEESRTQLSETKNIKTVLTPEATKFYLWLCGEASQSSSPRNAQWYHQNRWPDI